MRQEETDGAMISGNSITWRVLVTATMLVMAGAVPAIPARAQHVAVVHGEPITELDIEQRTKFTQLTTQKTPSRQDVIDELASEKRKVHEARTWGLEISDSEIDHTYASASLASRMRRTPEQLSQEFVRVGVNDATLKHRIRADLAWQKYMQWCEGPSPRCRGLRQ